MERDHLRWCCGSSSNDDWDLHAVVRLASCCSSGGGSRVTSPQSQKDDELTDAAALQQPPIGPAPAVDDFGLQQAFFATPPPQPRNEAPPQHQQPPPAKPRASSCRNNGPTRSKRKKKKSQVSNKDPWAWRKYGQKPIKGSPYPRGYYRCSTDKDCRARKQVERCRTDPSTLIVTYTGGEHSHPVPLHRNALAGTTRNRKKPQPAPADEEENTVATAGMLLEEDAEMKGDEEDVDVLLFLEPSSPSPSCNGSSGSKVVPGAPRTTCGSGCGQWQRRLAESSRATLEAPRASASSSDEQQQNGRWLSGGSGGGHERHGREVPFLRPNAVGGCSCGGGDQLGLTCTQSAHIDLEEATAHRTPQGAHRMLLILPQNAEPC